jgi:hypothetical protein
MLVTGTTDQYGTLQVPNPFGRTSLFLLRNTYNDGVGSSFGVINLEGQGTDALTFRFRTLKDGTPIMNTLINSGVVMAYVPTI